MTTDTTSLDDIDITSPEVYAAGGYPYAAWARLRREAPVYRYERAGLKPFWAITKYADVQRISRDPRTFSNAGGIVVASREEQEPEFPQRHLLTMDPPEHAKYRNLTNRRFTPRAMAVLEETVDRLSARVVESTVARIVDGDNGAGGDRCGVRHRVGSAARGDLRDVGGGRERLARCLPLVQ
jgi:cholest-4-en-3-one 26-monooxygenase